jgi:hypothetical protein
VELAFAKPKDYLFALLMDNMGLDSILAKHSKFFGPLTLTKSQGTLDFGIERKAEFWLPPTRITLLTLSQQKDLKENLDELIESDMIELVS